MRPRPAGPLTLVSHGPCLSLAVSHTANTRTLMERRPTFLHLFFLSHGRLHGKLVDHASVPCLPIPSQALLSPSFLSKKTTVTGNSQSNLTIGPYAITNAMVFPSNSKSMGVTGCGYFLLLLSKTHPRPVYSFPGDKANATQKRSM